MTKVILDEALRARLHDVREQLELCDETGSRLGNFVPAELYDRLLYDWANAQITDEELNRRLQRPGGRTLTEIWQRLAAT